MESKLVTHLARSEATALVDQLGKETLELLKKVGPDAVVPIALAELIVHMLGEEGALRNSKIRSLLFEKLKKDEAENLCEILQLSTSAPSLTLRGVDFQTDRGNLDVLNRFYNVTTESEDNRVEPTQNLAASHQLRDHQATAYRRLRRLIEDPTASALVHMPYGSGKLRTVATAVLDLYRAEDDGRIVTWLASGETVCEEVFKELNEVWMQLGSRNVTAYRLYGSHPIPDLSFINNGIVVADIQRISGDEGGLIALGQRTRVVVIGDAEDLRHAEVESLLDSMSKNAEFSLIGITASPAHVIAARSALGAIAARFAGFYITIDDNDPGDLLRRSGDVDEIEVEIKQIPTQTLQQFDLSGIDLSAAVMVSISKDVDRNHAILDMVLAEAQATEGSVVLFAATADHARLFAGLLRLRGTRASAITNEMSSSQIKLALQKYVSRAEKVLCVFQVFISGADFPQASTVIVAAPTKSSTVIHELVGHLASGRNRPADVLKFIFVGDDIAEYLTLAGGLKNWDALNV